MWGLVIQLGVWAGLYIANKLLQPDKPKPKPLTRDNLTLPRVEEGTPVPIVYGRCRVDAAVLAWMGDLKNVTIVNNVGQYTIVYGLDMLFAVGLPMVHVASTLSQFDILNPKNPRLHNVWYGDKKLTPPATGYLPGSGQSSIRRAQAVTKPEFHGGPGAGGGITGAYEFFWGAANNNFLSPPSAIGDSMVDFAGGDTTKVAGFRNMLLVAFTNLFGDLSAYADRMAPDGADNPGGRPPNWTLGENTSIDGFGFEVSSYGDVGADVSAMVNWGYDFGGDADPVAVIYDVLTNSWSRIGLDPSRIDKPSFLAASTTLLAEGHGYSRVHYEHGDGVAILSDVLRQIDAALYEEPTTGKLVLKLIRADYVVGALPVFDESNIHDVEDYGIGSWKESTNEVRISYTDRGAEFKTVTAVAQSLANATANANRRRVAVIEYPGISNADIASKVASRDLNVLSRPLKKITMVVNRDAYTLRPGSPFLVSSYSEYKITNVVFRAQRVDVGQLFDNKVVVDAVEDAFGSTYQGFGQTWNLLPLPIPYPITESTVFEAPRGIARRALLAGIINDDNIPRLFEVAAPSTNALRIALMSRLQPAVASFFGTSSSVPTIDGDPLTGVYYQDVPLMALPTTFQVQTTYPRELEPYDTTTGLVISNVIDASKSASGLISYMEGLSGNDGSIRVQASPLIMVVDSATGGVEILSFESVSNLGGLGVNGPYRLNNVWRGLMDTAPIALTSGSRGYIISSIMIGRRGYADRDVVNYQVVPASGAINGSGGDPRYAVTMAARAFLPIPPSDLRAAANLAAGTLGTPSVAGQFKSITAFEEGVDLYGNTRDRQQFAVARGDDASVTPQDFSPTAVYPFARLGSLLDSLPTTYVPTNVQGYGVAQTFGGALNAVAGALAGSVAVDGHGTVYLAARANRGLVAGDPWIGHAGLQLGENLTSWSPSEVSLLCAVWRNLAQNPRFAYAGGFSPWWTATAMTVQTGTSSVTRSATAKYAQANSASDGVLKQAVPIANYLPRGMTGLVAGYFRNLNADANDTAILRVDALDSSGVSLTFASSGLFVPAGTWTYKEASLALPASTAAIQWQSTSSEVAGGGTTNPDVAVSEAIITVGQVANATLTNLTNPSFETGTTASWTNVTNSFIVPAVITGPSSAYGQGGAFANSEIRQDFTLPAGYECGATAVLRFWRAQTIAGDTGEVIVEILDGTPTVIATVTTGAENLATLNVWTRRVLSVNVPDNAVTARVRLKAVRTGGAGNSGACFDELHLSIHKKIEPTFSAKMDFSAPTVQACPQTWQEYAIAYPQAAQYPSHLFAATSFASSFQASTTTSAPMDWSDNVAHDPGVMTGMWGDAVTARGSFQFTRQSGGAAVCFEAKHGAIDTIGAYGATTPFSVVCVFRVDELPWTATTCGLVGRKDLTAGWGLEVSAAGTPQVVIKGPGGTATAVSATVVNDGAIHIVAIVYDPVAQTVTCCTEEGFGAPVSTAAIGEFARAAFTCRLRVGRSADNVDTMPGQIANVYMFDSALTEDDVIAHWSYARNPTNLPITYTRSKVVWSRVGVGGVDAGDTVAAFGVNHFAMDDHAVFGTGVSLVRGHTNLVASWDFAGASWVKDAGASLVQGVLDATGRNEGVAVTCSTTDGFKTIGMTFSATATAELVFWAKAAGATGLTLELMNSANVVKNSQTVTVGTTWARFVVSFTGWDASTPTARIRWRSTAGTVTFTLATVVWVGQGTEVPVAYPGPLDTIGDVSFTWNAAAMPRQMNSEGEIYVKGIGMVATPPAAAVLVNLHNPVDSKNRRELQVDGTAHPVLNHYDATVPTNVTSTGTAFDWSQQWEVDGRWCRASTLDNAATPFAGVVTTASASSAVYGRSATFSENLTKSTVLDVNKGSVAGINATVQKITVRTREAKLP